MLRYTFLYWDSFFQVLCSYNFKNAFSICLLVSELSALKPGKWSFWPGQNQELTWNFMAKNNWEPWSRLSESKKQFSIIHILADSIQWHFARWNLCESYFCRWYRFGCSWSNACMFFWHERIDEVTTTGITCNMLWQCKVECQMGFYYTTTIPQPHPYWYRKLGVTNGATFFSILLLLDIFLEALKLIA